MSETFVCDCCDKRITSGYTVCWARKLTDSAAGVHFTNRSDEVRNLCEDCFPTDETSLTQKIKQALGFTNE